MSKLLLLIFLCSTNLLFSQFGTNEIKEISSQLPKGVKLSYDDVKGVAWISSRGVKLSGGWAMGDDRRTFVKLYFGLKKDNGVYTVMPLRIVNRTYREGWIFFDEVTYLVGDKEDRKQGTTKKFSFTDNDTQRTTYLGAYVKEKSDILVNEEIMRFIDYMLKTSKPVKIRFSGDENYDEMRVKGEYFVADFKGLLEAREIILEKYP